MTASSDSPGPVVDRSSDRSDLRKLAEIIQRKNQVDSEIARLVGRPAQLGSVGEYIAAQIFKIRLFESATHPDSDGRFLEGPLAGRTVNVKWYPRRENNVDLKPECDCDFHLVMTGPFRTAGRASGTERPWLITAVYLFETLRLIEELRQRGVRIGVAASVREYQWHAAEVYPQQIDPRLFLSDEQRELLALFG